MLDDLWWRLDVRPVDVGVDRRAEELVEERFRATEPLGQVRSDRDPVPVDRLEVTHEPEPAVRRQHARADVLAAVVAGELWCPRKALARIGQGIRCGHPHTVGLSVDREGGEPAEDVAAAVSPRRPSVAPDREEDASAGGQQLVGQLHAGLSRPDDEYGAGREGALVAVLV